MNCLITRMMSPNKAPDKEVLRNSTIQIVPDMTNQLMIQFVQREIIHTFQNVTKQMLATFNHTELLQYVDFPVNTTTPVYGRIDQPFIEFMAPGSILSIAHFAAISLTTMNLVVERIHGLLERTNVVGVSVMVIVASHMAAYTTVLLVQVILLLVVVLAIFQIHYTGSLALIAVLTFLQSICGMVMGLFISAVSDTENTATMLAIGLFYPGLLLSGTMWPLNAMNKWLRSFSTILPQTLPIQSMRVLMIRGWGFNYWEVVQGFVMSIIWIIIYLVLSVFAIKFRQY